MLLVELGSGLWASSQEINRKESVDQCLKASNKYISTLFMCVLMVGNISFIFHLLIIYHSSITYLSSIMYLPFSIFLSSIHLSTICHLPIYHLSIYQSSIYLFFKYTDMFLFRYSLVWLLVSRIKGLIHHEEVDFPE